jgi:hypothetical protein
MLNAPNRLKHTAISTETSEKIRQNAQKPQLHKQ